MSFTDEELMAYADGELDAATCKRIEEAMAHDLNIAQAVARHRLLANRLHGAFDPVLQEPVPDRLLSLVQGAKANYGSSESVADLVSARNKRQTRPMSRWSWPEWGAMAASLVLGVLAGQVSWRSAPGDLFATDNGQLVARAELAEALSNRLASEQSISDAVHIGLSFRAKGGGYCRAFSVLPPERRASEFAGVACREGKDWRLQMLARNAPATRDGSTYRQAGSTLPNSVLHAIEDSIDGEPLDAQGESAARRQGWRQ